MSNTAETPDPQPYPPSPAPGAPLVACLLAPASAAGAPKAPALTGTVPPSPSTSLTPLIRGRADGIITTRSRGAVRGPDRSQALRSLTITIYADPNCTGTVLAQPARVTSSKQAGIPVTVAPDSTTTFYATATDGALHVSPCSNPGLTYQQVTTGPGPPSPASVSPASPANDNTPQVSGSSAPGTTVKLFSSPTCTGTPLGSGSAVEFAAGGIQASVANDSTTTIYASASLAGVNSICSATSVTYREDSTPPAGPD